MACAQYASAQNCAYTLTKDVSTFIATRDADGSTVLANAVVNNVITAIKDDAAGNDCTITFGAGGNTLYLDSTAIMVFNGSPWGHLTLRGSVSGAAAQTLQIGGSASVTCEADVTNTAVNGTAISYAITGTLDIVGGTVSATLSGGRAIYHGSSGTVTVRGAATVTSSSADAPTIYVYVANGTLNLYGGTVQNTGGGLAVQKLPSGTFTRTVKLGNAPNVIGAIRAPENNIVVNDSGSDAFNPGSKVYTVETHGSYTEGASRAVLGGAAFAGNFAYVNAGYVLAPDGDDLIRTPTGSATAYAYTLTKSGATYIITRDEDGSVVSYNPTIHAAINTDLNYDVGGNDCSLTFGAGGNTLYLGTDFMNIGEGLGHLALHGSVSSASDFRTIVVNHVHIVCDADIANTSSANTTDGRNALQYSGNRSFDIVGGTISSLNGRAVLYEGSGVLTVRDSATITTARADAPAIYVKYFNNLHIFGGTVENTAGGPAVFKEGLSSGFYNSPVMLGKAPVITGVIRAPERLIAVNTSGANAFDPGSAVYAVEITPTAVVGGTTIAVVDGADFSGNFISATPGFRLAAGGNNLVLFGEDYLYTVSGSGGNFTATRDADGTTVGTANSPVQSVIDAVKTDADGNACVITFGTGAALNIASASMTFDGGSGGDDWGRITFRGAVTSAHPNQTLLVQNGVSATCDAEIANTGSGNVILWTSAGTLDVSGEGAVSGDAGIDNTGAGTVNIHNASVAATGFGGSGIVNSGTGTLNIYGGEVSAAGDGGAAAIHGFSGTVNVYGGTVSATGSGGIGLYDFGSATVNITGGDISATASDGTAVWNRGTGVVTIRGAATLANASPTQGTLRNDGSGKLDIFGGTVENNGAGPAVVNANAAMNSVRLGNTPVVNGVIRTPQNAFGIIPTVIDTFKPGNNRYTVEITTTPIISGSTIAVVYGAYLLDYHLNFDTVNAGYYLGFNGNSLVLTENDYRYVITQNDGTFTARREADTRLIVGAPNVSIAAVFNAIKVDAEEQDCHITFGSGGNTLDLGNGTLVFYHLLTPTAWGRITLHGAVTSSHYGSTIYIQEGVTVTSDADIENTAESANAIIGLSSTTLDIVGGTLSAPSGTAVVNYGEGVLTVREPAELIGVSEQYGVIYNYSNGVVNIVGGTVRNTEGGYAVVNKVDGIINLGGAPTLVGGITSAENGIAVITSGDDAFDPGSATYKVHITTDPIVNGVTVAVADGAGFQSNFTSMNAGYYAVVGGGDLVLAQDNHQYTITGSGASFTAVRDIDGSVVGAANVSVANVITAISTDAAGSDCVITFGAGGSSLDTGTVAVIFDGAVSPAWGSITLRGSVISVNNDIHSPGTVRALNGVSVTSEGYIGNFAANANVAVVSDSGATFEINAGKITAPGGIPVNNNGGGALTVRGSAAVTGGSKIAPAIYNASSGTVNILGGILENTNGGPAVLNAANGAVNLGGTPEIYGAIVSPEGGIQVNVRSGGDNFKPGKTIYTVEITTAPIVPGSTIAVVNGFEFIDYFAVANAGYWLEVNRRDLVLTDVPPVVDETDIIITAIRIVDDVNAVSGEPEKRIEIEVEGCVNQNALYALFGHHEEISARLGGGSLNAEIVSAGRKRGVNDGVGRILFTFPMPLNDRFFFHARQVE
ncbi:MAG: hypothetical protein FWG50_10425 [Kiritimatiellaeota bacterium]|nr:hypothetical protein [Kiritimatiellota bacterium]